MTDTPDPSTKLVAYKAFDKNMTCRGFTYEVGQTYHHEGEISMCEAGFHACTVPFDCWNYYEGSGTFAQVELGDVSDETREDSKRVAASITIQATLTLPEWIKAQAAAVVDLCRSAKGTLASEGHAASTGHRGHAASTGDWGHAASTGDWGHAASKGKNSIAASVGVNGSAEGALGTWLVLACYDDDINVLAVRTTQVDGEQIKPDTPYRLVADGDDFTFQEAN